jgi:hypothetical protein
MVPDTGAEPAEGDGPEDAPFDLVVGLHYKIEGIVGALHLPLVGKAAAVPPVIVMVGHDLPRFEVVVQEIPHFQVGQPDICHLIHRMHPRALIIRTPALLSKAEKFSPAHLCS